MKKYAKWKPLGKGKTLLDVCDIRILLLLSYSVPEEKIEESKPRSAPVFVSKPEPCTVEEGEWARFCCRVTGHPRPRVMWLINGHTVVNGSRYKLTYDGMYHMDVPKTRQYDTGKVEVIARSSVGEAIAETELKVIPRHDDYRGVLKNSPRRKFCILKYIKYITCILNNAQNILQNAQALLEQNTNKYKNMRSNTLKTTLTSSLFLSFLSYVASEGLEVLLYCAC